MRLHLATFKPSGNPYGHYLVIRSLSVHMYGLYIYNKLTIAMHNSISYLLYKVSAFSAWICYLFYHLMPYLDNGKMPVVWVVPQCRKKYDVTFLIKKIEFTALCSHRVFQRTFCTKSHDPFEKWTFIFVHFRRAMPFLFWTF